jgi:uncharacterized protein (DUF2164 family)
VTTLRLDDIRRERLIAGLQGLHVEQFDEEISRFRAEQLLDHLLAALGPQIYNQAVQDARAYMQQKLDDLDGEVHLPEQP